MARAILVSIIAVTWTSYGPGAATIHAASFTQDVAPLLIAKCAACHGPQKQQGDYRLDTFDFFMAPGASEDSPIVAGHPADSLLYQLITETDEDDRMPQKDDPLTIEQTEIVKAWIAEGAVFDGPSQKAPLASYAGPSDHPAPPEFYPAPIPILSLAFRPDGQEMAVGGYHEVMIWKTEEPILIRRLTNISERVYSLAWSTNISCLAVAGGTPGRGGDLRVVDPESGALIRLLRRTIDSVLCTRFSRDGSKLVAAGADHAVRVFDTGDWSETLVIEQHADWVMDARFDESGQHLVTASRDKSARVFDAMSGELITTFFDHQEPVFAAVFAHDSKEVWSGGRDGVLRLWEITEAKQQGKISWGSEEVIRVLTVDQDLISVAGRFVYCHESTDQRRQRWRLDQHADRVYALDVSPATDRLVSGDHAGKVCVWQLSDGGLVREFVAAPKAD